MPAAARRHALVASALMLSTLTFLGGCGGDGGESVALSRAEFIAQGDRICQRTREEFVAAQPPAPSTPQRAVALQRTLIKASEGELSALRALDPPAELKPAVDRYLSVRERGVALMEQGLRAAQKEDLPAYAAARRRLSAGQVSRLHLAQAVGFTACSRPGGSASGG